MRKTIKEYEGLYEENTEMVILDRTVIDLGGKRLGYSKVKNFVIWSILYGMPI